MFVKRKKQIRRKSLDSDDEDDGAAPMATDAGQSTDTTPNPTPNPNANPNPNPKPKPIKPPTHTLSFDLEDEDEVKIRKSRASKALRKGNMSHITKALHTPTHTDDLILNAPTIARPQTSYVHLKREANPNPNPNSNPNPNPNPNHVKHDRRVRFADSESDMGETYETAMEVETAEDEEEGLGEEEEFIPLPLRDRYRALRKDKTRAQTHEANRHDVMHDDFDPLAGKGKKAEIADALGLGLGEEEDEWEEEQLRRAARVTEDTSSVQQRSRSSSVPSTELSFFISTLQQTSSDLASSLTTQERRLAAVNEQLKVTQAELDTIQIKARNAASSFEWLQNMRSFSSDMVGLARAKEPLIKEFEEVSVGQLQKIKDRRTLFRLETQEDIIYDLRKTHEVVSLCGYVPRAILKEGDTTNATVLDEFGREVGLGMEGLWTRRARIRSQRLKERNQRRSGNGYESGLGLGLGSVPVDEDEDAVADSDYGDGPEEMNTDELMMQKLATASSLVLADAQERYTSLQNILNMFSSLRTELADKYKAAFISTSLAEVLGPLVRLQLLDDVMHEVATNQYNGTLKHPWLSHVTRFSSGDDAPALSVTLASHMQTLIHSLVLKAFQPCSRRSNTMILSLMTLLWSMGSPAPSLFQLQQDVASEFKQEIARLCVPVIRTPTPVPQQTPIHTSFIKGQLALASKIGCNVLDWKGILPNDMLEGLGDDIYKRVREGVLSLLDLMIRSCDPNTQEVPPFASAALEVLHGLTSVMSRVCALSPAPTPIQSARASEFAAVVQLHKDTRRHIHTHTYTATDVAIVAVRMKSCFQGLGLR